MEHSVAVHALIQKRAEISGVIADLEGQIHQARINLQHIDATIRLLDPSVKVATIRAKSPVKGRSSLFSGGEMSLLLRDTIREANGEALTADTMVQRIMAGKGLDLADKTLRSELIRRFLNALHRMAMAGYIEKVGRGPGTAWKTCEQGLQSSGRQITSL